MRIGQNCNFHLRNINLKRGDTITWSKASTNACISQKAVKAKLDSTKQRCPRWTSYYHQTSWRGKGAPPAETQGTRQGTSSTLYPAIKVQHSVWLACLSMRQIQTMSRFATITVIEASMLYSKAFLASVTYQCFLTFFLVTHLKKKNIRNPIHNSTVLSKTCCLLKVFFKCWCRTGRLVFKGSYCHQSINQFEGSTLINALTI